MKTLTAAQKQAHDRLIATLPVKTHLKPEREGPSAQTLQRQEATRKMLETRRLQGRTNTWIEPDPTPKRKYVRRDPGNSRKSETRRYRARAAG